MPSLYTARPIYYLPNEIYCSGAMPKDDRRDSVGSRRIRTRRWEFEVVCDQRTFGLDRILFLEVLILTDFDFGLRAVEMGRKRRLSRVIGIRSEGKVGK